MSIAAIASSNAQTGFDRPTALPASRSLVPVEPSRAQPRPMAATSARRMTPDAALVAHLWAARENVPQSRARRRATPGLARSAYETAGALKDRPSATLGRYV